MPTPSLCQVMGGWDCPCSKALASFSMTILASLFGFSAALHGTTSNAIIAHRGESGPITLFWDIDGSDAIVTPPGVRRNSSVNIYGFNGVYPRINPDNSTVNGGVPQAGNLSLHLAAYATDLVRKIPDPHFKGACLLDFEQWRADWNSTPPQYRTLSLQLAKGDVAAAVAAYERGARTFMLATINTTKTLRPNCSVGWYGYPISALPHAATPAWKAYCASHPGVCFFDRGGPPDESGYAGPGGAAQRSINDNLHWLFGAVDIVTPSVYLGIPPKETTPGNSSIYVRSTVAEAVRVASAVGKNVVPSSWFRYDNYWENPPPAVRALLTPADLSIELGDTFAAGASGVLLWGALDGTNHSEVTAVQKYVDGPLTSEVRELCNKYGC